MPSNDYGSGAQEVCHPLLRNPGLGRALLSKPVPHHLLCAVQAGPQHPTSTLRFAVPEIDVENTLRRAQVAASPQSSGAAGAA
eukprot:12364429-Prorocentrum_lima.AAC.1